jgi:hypothetical protein
MTQAAVLGANASIMSTPVGTAPGYMARAWVNFNGTGTVAIRASGNVTSITDNGTGDYTANFTTAMSDANYVVAGLCRSSGVSSGAPIQVEVYSTSSTRFLTLNASFNPFDPVQVNIVIHR